ncbi:MAG TPA: RtcB family protein [Deltaproteobacteria bacterium]|nr:RtcB family protein [Deltaproteobacteria bacterium]
MQIPPMRTNGIVYANADIERSLGKEAAIEQVANVACLPGIVGSCLAMPDIHWGYGFPIGGVAAFSTSDGIISPGGVGYDINCGIRCISTSLCAHEVLPVIERLLAGLYRNIPSGVGSVNKALQVGKKEFGDVLVNGASWAVKKGFTPLADLEAHEDRGCIEGANPDMVSVRAVERGLPQLGTLGSGNHFLELDVVDEIIDPETAKAFGLFQDQIVVLVHTGSRGLGHQVCDDYVHSMLGSAHKYKIDLPDRQLACAPFSSSHGRAYWGAMAAAANFAFANRELVTFLIRETFEEVFNRGCEKMGMGLLYDCCHNIAKKEGIVLKGQKKEVCIHRKGATRAFPPGDLRLPGRFRATGQPVLVPGDMGRYSFILAGADNAHETFFSACHGAGRLLSRRQAKKLSKGRSILDELKRKNILAMAASRVTLAEEIPEAYKDVSEVVDTIAGAGIARVVARLVPVAMVKG